MRLDRRENKSEHPRRRRNVTVPILCRNLCEMSTAKEKTVKKKRASKKRRNVTVPLLTNYYAEICVHTKFTA